MHVNEIRISHLSTWIDQPIIHFNILAVCYCLFDITRINTLRVYKGICQYTSNRRFSQD
jgi:hypothetical protein